MIPETLEKQLRSFARVMALAFVVFGLLLLIRRKPEFLLAWVMATLFYVTGMIRPKWLSWAYIIWMKFAFVLSWVNTRILLCVIFYGIMAPVGLAIRLFGFDPLERAFNKGKRSYWIPRQKRAFSKSDYEKLY